MQSYTFFPAVCLSSTTDSNYGRVQKGIIITLFDFKDPHPSTHSWIYVLLEMKTPTFLAFSSVRRLIWLRRNNITTKGFQTAFAVLQRLCGESPVWKKHPKTCLSFLGETSNLSVIAVTSPPKLAAAATASFENVSVFCHFVLFSGFCHWKTIL